MPITNGYATLAEFRSYVGDSIADTDLSERAVEAASRSIDRYCGRRFYADGSGVARTFAPDCSDVLMVPDISSTTDLVVATDTDANGSYDTTWATTDYQLEPTNALVDGEPYTRIRAIDRYTFPLPSKGRASVRVTARWGWPSVPTDIETACLILATRLYKRKDAPQGILGSLELGVVRLGATDHDVKALLDPYRLFGIA